jgi:hypothetical protein
MLKQHMLLLRPVEEGGHVHRPSILRHLFLALGFVVASEAIEAQQATSLVAFFGIDGPCASPPPCVFTRTAAGVAVPLSVGARDSSGNPAFGYQGTVTFSSSDPLATLPSLYTFTAGDAGNHLFGITLQTLGSQTVTVTDSANGFTASVPILVIPSASASIPATTNQTKLVMFCLLGMVGVWFLARNAA